MKHTKENKSITVKQLEDFCKERQITIGRIIYLSKEEVERATKIFCTDYHVSPLIARQNARNKWEFWAIAGFENGEPQYSFSKDWEFDDLEVTNSTSGRAYIKVLKDGNWREILFAQNKPITPVESGTRIWQFRDEDPMHIKLFVSDTSLTDISAGLQIAKQHFADMEQ